MTKLIVTGDYKSSLGEYHQGQILEISDEQAALLMRDSPGSFCIFDITGTGLTVPDRRMRGGRVR